MARGGKREGAGGKPTWKHGKTKPVRVPIALAEKILEIAKVLDEGDFSEVEPEAEVIDLTGVAIISSKEGPVIRLSDLIRVGYRIKPERLARNLKPISSLGAEIAKLLESEGNHD